MEASDYFVKEHLREHEEAYKNQAVNDYRHAQATNPERYPEALNYPGYTDQVSSAPEAEAAYKLDLNTPGITARLEQAPIY